MATLLSWLLVILAGMLAIPTALLCLEVVAGLLQRPVPLRPAERRGRVTVSVPA
jgi:hypothetical protein